MLIASQLGVLVALLLALLLARHLLSVVLHNHARGASGNSAIFAAMLLTALTAVAAALRAVYVYSQRILGELATRDATDHILDVACAADLADFDDPSFHDRLMRARAATLRLPAVMASLGGVTGALAGAAASLLALLVVQPLIAPLAVVVLIPAWIAAARGGLVFYRFAFGFTAKERERAYLANVMVAREAAKELRAFELEYFLRLRHDRLYDERIAGIRGVARRHLVLTLVANLIGALIIAASLVALILLVRGQHLSVAGAATAAVAIALLGQRLGAAGASAGALSESALFLEDLVTLPETESDWEARPPQAVPLAPPTPEERPLIDVRDVTFSYPGATRPAVDHVTLSVRPGEVVALVGRNGSGKTTLAKLIAGLYVPQGGAVRWDGVATADCDRVQLRRRCAVIFQDFLRYALTAYDNIALGRPQRSGDETAVRAAAARAGADRDIDRLPRGYQTLLGPEFEGGLDLSLGQWQRIALARVFFRDAPVVILDEPTASLDAEAEEELFGGIRELLSDRSVLLISHRFTTVRHADRIYVLGDGAVIESGIHEQLLELGGTYARLFGLQAAPYR